MDFRKLTIQKADLFVIAGIVLLALVIGVAFLLPKQNNCDAVVQIYQNGQLVQEVPLQEDKTVTLTGTYENIIQICDGKVSIVDSDCPGEDCVHTGWISTPGTSIICLPNRVEVRIAGQGDVDLIVG